MCTDSQGSTTAASPSTGETTPTSGESTPTRTLAPPTPSDSDSSTHAQSPQVSATASAASLAISVKQERGEEEEEEEETTAIETAPTKGPSLEPEHAATCTRRKEWPTLRPIRTAAAVSSHPQSATVPSVKQERVAWQSPKTEGRSFTLMEDHWPSLPAPGKKPEVPNKGQRPSVQPDDKDDKEEEEEAPKKDDWPLLTPPPTVRRPRKVSFAPQPQSGSDGGAMVVESAGEKDVVTPLEGVGETTAVNTPTSGAAAAELYDTSDDSFDFNLISTPAFPSLRTHTEQVDSPLQPPHTSVAQSKPLPVSSLSPTILPTAASLPSPLHATPDEPLSSENAPADKEAMNNEEETTASAVFTTASIGGAPRGTHSKGRGSRPRKSLFARARDATTSHLTTPPTDAEMKGEFVQQEEEGGRSRRRRKRRIRGGGLSSVTEEAGDEEEEETKRARVTEDVHTTQAYVQAMSEGAPSSRDKLPLAEAPTTEGEAPQTSQSSPPRTLEMDVTPQRGGAEVGGKEPSGSGRQPSRDLSAKGSSVTLDDIIMTARPQSLNVGGGSQPPGSSRLSRTVAGASIEQRIHQRLLSDNEVEEEVISTPTASAVIISPTGMSNCVSSALFPHS